MSRFDQLRREEYPLPASTDGLLSLLREVLNAPGLVQRVCIEAGEPLVLYRELEAEGIELADELVDLEGALRRARFMEYEGRSGASSAEILLDLFHYVAGQGLWPVCWAAGSGHVQYLARWLEFDARGMPTMWGAQGLTPFGIPVHGLGSLPDDLLILCAGRRRFCPGLADVEFAIKTTVEFRVVQDGAHGHPVVDPVGDSPEGDARPAGTVAVAPGRGFGLLGGLLENVGARVEPPGALRGGDRAGGPR